MGANEEDTKVSNRFIPSLFRSWAQYAAMVHLAMLVNHWL